MITTESFVSDLSVMQSAALLSPDAFAALKLARYEIRLRAQREAIIPTFPGSTLRGAFGHALKNAVCVMPHRNCANCLVASRCVYPYVFETTVPEELRTGFMRGQQDAPHPYLLDPPIYQRQRQPSAATTETTSNDDPAVRPNLSEHQRRLAAGDDLIFGLTLMGQAVEHLPYVVFALHEMAERGLGVNRQPFALREVAIIHPTGTPRTIYSSETERFQHPPDSARGLDEYIRVRMEELVLRDTLRLRFVTPMRIKVGGDLQPHVSFELLMRNLLRRLAQLCAIHGAARLELDYRTMLERAAGVLTQSGRLNWWDVQRYSMRQQTRLRMGGFVGEMMYRTEQIREFLPLLIAGEIVRAGRGTSFGLGRYEIIA